MSQVKHKFNSLNEFYPYYLAEHSNVACRRLHVLGSSFGLLSVGAALYSQKPAWLLAGLVSGYACAWVGHFVFEKNKPATFQYPLYSFASDWIMYKDVLLGKVSLRDSAPRA